MTEKKQTIAELAAAIRALETGGATSAGADPLEDAPLSSTHKQPGSSPSCIAHAPALAQAEEVFARILKIVSFRDYSEAEVRSKLAGESFEQEHIDCAIERAKNCGIIDDTRFADSFIRGRISAGKGIAGVERELACKGIDPASIPGWPYDYLEDGEEGECRRALMLLERKPPRSKNARDGAYRKLVSHGFTASVAQDAARAWAEREKLQ